MSTAKPASAEHPVVDLRDPGTAALLAWLWPGAGHLYQRRYAKGALYMICILGTYFFGLAIGEGKVVYAAWNPSDHRWQYALQAGVGLPAAPAIVQTIITRRGGEPILGGIMAPPRVGPFHQPAELAKWHKDLNQQFEMGTLYTVVAGILNVLAIFDALWGPAFPAEEDDKSSGDKDDPPGDPGKAHS